MSQHIIEELKTTLGQDFTISLNRVYQMAGVSIGLVLFNDPAGTFTVSIKSGSATLESKSFTAAQVISALESTDGYMWGRVSLEFDQPLKLRKGTYTIELSSSGYTFGESAYLGWIRPHENIWTRLTYTPTGDLNKPLDYRLFELGRL